MRLAEDEVHGLGLVDGNGLQLQHGGPRLAMRRVGRNGRFKLSTLQPATKAARAAYPSLCARCAEAMEGDMDVRQGFVDCGRTPLIRLAKLSAETGCEILGKAEFMNPGGSVKDRAALYIIRDAERRGVLQPGGTVVEGTAGNTGIGLAHICAARGYRCVIVIPDTQSPDKMAILRTLGAEVRRCRRRPTVTRTTIRRLPGGSRTNSTTRCGPTSSTTSSIARRTTRRPG